MKKLVLLFVFCSTCVAHAGPLHFIKTHKELLASDAVILASLSADAASSVRCQDQLGAGCIETSPALGRHPSAGKTWGVLLGFGTFIVAANHGATWLANSDPVRDRAYRHFIWIPTVAIAGFEGPNVWRNVCVIEHTKAQEEARARLGN